MAHIFETEPPERYRKALWRKRLLQQKRTHQATKRLQRVGTGPTPKKFRPFLEAEPLANLRRRKFILQYKEHGPTISKITDDFVYKSLVNFTCVLAGFTASGVQVPKPGVHIKLKPDLRQSDRLRLAGAYSQYISLKLSGGRDPELLSKIPLRFDVVVHHSVIVVYIKDGNGHNLLPVPVRIHITHSELNRALKTLRSIAKTQKGGPNEIFTGPTFSPDAMRKLRRLFNV